jgi:hypothetical protein
MKKTTFSLLFSFYVCVLTAQNPSHEDKLVATCKVWSYLKYFHDGPTYCQVNWDSALVSNLPKIKQAQTKAEFNTTLQQLINAAGDMPLPISYPANFNTNLNTTWFNDTIFDPAITQQLTIVKDRFRPHKICFVTDNSYNRTG